MCNEIKINDLYFSYENIDKTKKINVFDGLNLSFDIKKITSIIGHSGCGKTTLLRLLIGLIKTYKGDIIIPENVKFGMIFQEDRLMPWLNLYENVIFGLKNIDNIKVSELIEIIGLSQYKNLYPFELSGGMKQRVAIARTLVYDTNMILMDEPFSALDAFTRKKMQGELLSLKKKLDIGIIFVTHSIDEALSISDKIIFIDDNKKSKVYNIEENSEMRDLTSTNFINLKNEILLEVSKIK